MAAAMARRLPLCGNQHWRPEPALAKHRTSLEPTYELFLHSISTDRLTLWNAVGRQNQLMIFS
jgi:hypothetical protein